jgi:hypothetical protein
VLLIIPETLLAIFIWAMQTCQEVQDMCVVGS